MRRDHSARVWLGLACLLPVAAVGCQGLSSRVSHKSLDQAQASADKAVDKSQQFKNEVGPSQRVNVHLDLGRALETQGNFESAIAEYQRAIEACDAPGAHRGDAKVTTKLESLAHRRMGGALDRLGRFAQAETHYRAALKLSPTDVNVWNDAGYSYYLQSRWGDAERSLKTAAKLDPNNARVQTNLGLTLAAFGKNDEALEALSKAGGPAVGHANLGYILAATGKKEEARTHYQAALDLQPQFEAARVALAQLEGHGPMQAANLAPNAGLPVPSAPSEVVSTTPIVMGTPASSDRGPIPAAPLPSPTLPIVAPQPIATPVAVAPVARPSALPVPRPAAAANASAPAPSTANGLALISSTPSLASRRAVATATAPPSAPARPVTVIAAATSLPSGSRVIMPATADRSLNRASADTGIPLPARRSTTISSPSQAANYSGIPLPGQAGPTLEGPK